MPPLLADFTHARPCKPFCEKYLTLPRKREFPPAHLSVPILSRFAKNGRKKSSKSFSDLLLHVPLWGSGYSVVK